MVTPSVILVNRAVGPVLLGGRLVTLTDHKKTIMTDVKVKTLPINSNLTPQQIVALVKSFPQYKQVKGGGGCGCK